MAIQDDFTIDYVNRRITYTTAFVDDRPPNIYKVNALYSWLQDTFDEPAQMDDPIPMSYQTPTQYTLLYPWFMDDNSMKALYGGSIQTSSWAKSGSDGITQLRWDAASDAPVAGDIGVTLTGGTSSATGVLLAVDTTRSIAFVRNTSSAQFQDDENVTGTGVDFDVDDVNGFQTGESIWSNPYSVGTLQTASEIYIGQEDDYQGGRAYHTATTYATRMEKVDEWWDSDVDFSSSPNPIGGIGHFDILVKVREADVDINSRRLAGFARRFGAVYSHFEWIGAASPAPVVFTSVSSDLNSQDGPYTANFDNRAGATFEVGDVLENDTGTTPVGRLRAIATAVTGGGSATGSFEYYLIGENEALTTYDRTLKQFDDDDDVKVRDDTTTFDINGSPSKVSGGPAETSGISVTFANAQVDVNEDGTDEEYACTVDCSDEVFSVVYKRLMFLCCRGNQDGTTADTQDTLLPSAVSGTDEAGEFYRAVGDITVPWDGKTGTAPAEGAFVTNAASSWTASGVIVSLSNAAGASGQLVLTQVKGTWANNDPVAVPGQQGSNEVTVNGTPATIADNTGAPFGTFAGGRFFFARGVVPTNVNSSDANNWETTDLLGTRRVPPTVRTITLAGTVANDRGFVAEVDTAGGIDITKNQNGVGAAGAAQGTSSIPLDSTVALDVPTTGWIRVVDVDSAVGEEYRFNYSSVSGTTVTLYSGAALSGTTTSAGTSTVLNDTGAFASFGSNDNPKIGMQIRNTTDGSRAVILRKIDNDSIETTPLTGGTGNDWGSGDAWEANTVPVALVDADTVYFPFIDDVASGMSLTVQVKYVEDTDLIARLRFSDPDIGGTRIIPFELTSITLTDANLTINAIRTTDTVAS